MERSQFTFYRSFWDAIKRLRKKEDRLSALEAICAYALDGDDIEKTDAAEALFCIIKPILDTAAKKSKGGTASVRKAEDADKTTERCEEDADKTDARLDEDADNKNKNKNKNKDKYKNKCYNAHTRFVPPTVDEVAAYCMERGNAVDAQQFCDFYEAKGWRVGNQQMRDWKAAVRTWERRDKPKQEQPKTFADMWREMADDET